MTIDEYYDKLNAILDKFILNIEYEKREKELNIISKLSKIILMHSELYYAAGHGFKEKVDLNQTINICSNFLKFLNPIYAEQFNSIINNVTEDGTPLIKFIRANNGDYNTSKVGIDGKTKIYYNETIHDTFTLIHEIFHILNLQPYVDNESRDYLGETISITSELLLEKFLIQTKFKNCEINNNKRNIFISCYEDASIFLFEKHLLDLYIALKKDGKKIDRETLSEYINTLDKNSIEYKIFMENSTYFLDDIVYNGKLSLFFRKRYIIGIILASYLFYQIEVNQNNLEMFIRINHILADDRFSLEDILKTYNLDIDDEFTIQKLSDSFSKLLSNIDLLEKKKVI